MNRVNLGRDPRVPRLSSAVRSLIVLLVAALPLLAQSHDHHHHAVAPPAQTARTFAIPDVDVITHTGQTVRFSTLTANRVVAVNFIFTTCTTVCPVMGARTASLQSLLGKRAADVAIVSISIDPKNDTPERLAAWAKRFSAKPGWTLVTGEHGQIERLLRAFGVPSADPASHTPLLLIGDASGNWERVDGLAEPSRVVKLLEQRMAAR